MLGSYLQQCSTLIWIEPNAQGFWFAMHSQFENKLVYNLNHLVSNSAFKDIIFCTCFMALWIYTNRILNWDCSTTKKMQTGFTVV
jgi:hypothetical protein